MTLARSAGQLTEHDPEYDRRSGRIAQRFDFEAPIVMTEDHLKSAILFAALRLKNAARVHELGELAWPPNLDVMPRRDCKGATIVLETYAKECRPALWLN